MAIDSTVRQILEQLQAFDDQLKRNSNHQQQTEAESSWKSLDASNEAVYSEQRNTLFDASFIGSLREHTQHFTGNLPPSQFKQQTAAVDFYHALSQNIPDAFRFTLNQYQGELGWQQKNQLSASTVKNLPEINDDINSYQERLNHLRTAGCLEQLTDKAFIIEIGGGFGALAHAIKQIKPKSQYFIVDLATSLKFSYSWLTLQGYRCQLMNSASDMTLINQDDIDFFLINSEDKSLLNNINFDLAINTLSFTEMPRVVVDDYGLFLQQRLAVKQGILFEQNNEYPHHAGTEKIQSTTEIFSHYFSQQHLVTVCSMLGKVRLWSNRTNPIYHNKLKKKYPTDKYDIALFGASYLGDLVSTECYSPDEISYFYDNDPKKWGEKKNGIAICAPSDIEGHIKLSEKRGKSLVIIIASRYIHPIYQQLAAFKSRAKFINELEYI